MKKKIRTITVDGQEYAWKVGVDDSYYLTIWKNRKILSRKTLNYGTITPKIVAEEIRKIEA